LPRWFQNELKFLQDQIICKSQFKSHLHVSDVRLILRITLKHWKSGVLCVSVSETCVHPYRPAHRSEGHQKNNQWNIVRPSIQHWHCTYTLITHNSKDCHMNTTVLRQMSRYCVNNRPASWKPIDCRCCSMSMCRTRTCLSYLWSSEMLMSAFQRYNENKNKMHKWKTVVIITLPGGGSTKQQRDRRC